MDHYSALPPMTQTLLAPSGEQRRKISNMQYRILEIKMAANWPFQVELTPKFTD